MLRSAFTSRTCAAVAVVALGALLTGCAPGPEHPAIEGTVTFKTIERPHLESCDPDDEYGCGHDRMQEISTDYRVEITYPDDKPLRESGEYTDYAGHECWFSVQPDEYAAVELGQKVMLGSPLNAEYAFNTYPTTCDLIDDLSPNGPAPTDEWTPSDEEFGQEPGASTSPTPTEGVQPATGPSNPDTSEGDSSQQ
jgi:hypothetical protein